LRGILIDERELSIPRNMRKTYDGFYEKAFGKGWGMEGKL